MELGLGIHGEPGIKRSKVASADEVVKTMIDLMTNTNSQSHLPLTSGDSVVVCVNNLGALSSLEMAVITRATINSLESRGMVVARVMCGSFMTSLEMAGFSISLMRTNQETLRLFDTKTSAPFWPNLSSTCVSGHSYITKPEATRPQLQDDTPSEGPLSPVLHNVLVRVCSTLLEKQEELNSLDRAAGDGDCGYTHSQAAKAIQEWLQDHTVPACPGKLLSILAGLVQEKMGGSSGALYSLFLTAAAGHLTAGQNSAAAWADAMLAGTQAMKRYGGADTGDRTMLDALCPAVDEMRKLVTSPPSGHMSILQAAVQKAAVGAESTRSLTAKAGRASYIAVERVNLPDPGAVAVAAMFKAVLESLNQSCYFYVRVGGAFSLFFHKMSLQGSFLSDEQFQCAICLDLFTNPSSTPCGHSFCLRCISEYWSSAKVCRCPLCKKNFQKRPNLQINRTLQEITEQFKAMRRAGVTVMETRGDGGMPHSFVEEMKQSQSHFMKKLLMAPALKDTVIPTLASSLPDHSPLSALNHASRPPPPPPPISNSRGRRRFTLAAAASSSNLPLCKVHHRGLLIYCKNDQVCICPECETEDHYDHDTVTIKEEWMEKKVQLHLSEQLIQEMIRQRIRKIEEIRESVSHTKLAVETEMAGSVRLFSALTSAMESTQVELMETMEESQKAAEQQADAMLSKLEEDNIVLQRRLSDLDELVQSDDYTHCIKTFPLLILPPPVQDWSAVCISSCLGTSHIYKRLAAQMERFMEELKAVAEKGFLTTAVNLSPVQPQPRMKRLQEYAVDVTMDANTAHPRLIISDDMKSVWCSDHHQLLPDNQERFDRIICVLGREMISSGKHYWEVDVTGKTDWDLGVARKSVNRKGKITVTPSNGYWFLSLRDKNKYAFCTVHSSDVQLNLQPHKIGIFVDFENGQVSFYNVNARVHIYTFNDSFSESIYPFFSPCSNKYGKNDEPLTITPVNVTE